MRFYRVTRPIDRPTQGPASSYLLKAYIPTFEAFRQFFREQHVGQFALAVGYYGPISALVVVDVVEIDRTS